MKFEFIGQKHLMAMLAALHHTVVADPFGEEVKKYINLGSDQVYIKYSCSVSTRSAKTISNGQLAMLQKSNYQRPKIRQSNNPTIQQSNNPTVQQYNNLPFTLHLNPSLLFPISPIYALALWKFG